jgi:hypothetical protein
MSEEFPAPDLLPRRIERLFAATPPAPEIELGDLRADLRAAGIEATIAEIRGYARFCAGHLAQSSVPQSPEWVIHSCLVDDGCFEGLVSWLSRQVSPAPFFGDC